MTISDETMVEVRSLTDLPVTLFQKDKNLRITFQKNQVRKMKAGDIRELNFEPGIHVLFTEYLSVGDPELAAEIGVSDQVLEYEYQWTVKDVQNLLTDGLLEELEDVLNCAPQGIVDTIVDQAVEMRLNDVAKRDLIKQYTGQDITKKLEVKDRTESAANGDAPKTTSSQEGGRKIQKTTERKIGKTAAEKAAEAEAKARAAKGETK